MFGKGVTLFRILGFNVRVDLSWLILAVLVTWSLASGFFPRSAPRLTAGTYWWMGAAGTIGLFASILFHEFCHSLVARHFGLPMNGITLFIFGGVAEMDDEPPSPKAEFLMAMAGPASSVILGGLFYLAALAGETAVGGIYGAALVGVLGYLALINWVLAAFNLVPAFPLDGGRVLRAGIWHRKKDLRRATRIASRIGSAFGLAVIFLGVVNILTGNFIGGFWQFMIGMFLRSAAQMSYRQVLYRKSLEGATVARFLNKEPITAPVSITIRELVEQYFYRYPYKMFPVKQDDRLAGCITSGRVKEIPVREWDSRTVGEVLEACSADNSISPDTSAVKAFSLMGRTGKSRLMVVKNQILIGVVSLKDIMGYLSTRIDLETSEEKDERRAA